MRLVSLSHHTDIKPTFVVYVSSWDITLKCLWFSRHIIQNLCISFLWYIVFLSHQGCKVHIKVHVCIFVDVLSASMSHIFFGTMRSQQITFSVRPYFPVRQYLCSDWFNDKHFTISLSYDFTGKFLAPKHYTLLYFLCVFKCVFKCVF